MNANYRRPLVAIAAILLSASVAACGSSGGGQDSASDSKSVSGPGKPAKPTPATQSEEGVIAAERALVKAYETKRIHNAYLLQSNRCRKLNDFDTYHAQILMAFGMLPDDLDWTIQKVEVHEINADKTVAKAEVHIPDLVAAWGSSGEGDRWLYETREDGSKSWGLDDCEPAAK